MTHNKTELPVSLPIIKTCVFRISLHLLKAQVLFVRPFLRETLVRSRRSGNYSEVML